VIAATLTSVCLAFPTVCAVAAGYKVYAVVDASGNWSKMATDLTIARVVQAGAIPIDTLAVISEMRQTWNRPDALDFANIFCRPPDAELPAVDGELRQGSECGDEGARNSLGRRQRLKAPGDRVRGAPSRLIDSESPEGFEMFRVPPLVPMRSSFRSGL
jgi:hypothetical protein